MTELIAVLIGLAVGAFAAWLWLSRRGGAAEATISEVRVQLEKAERDFQELRARLDREREARVKAETEFAEARKNLEEQKQTLQRAREELTDTFKALSADALRSSGESFLELAKKQLETVLAESKGDLEKRREAIEGLVKPLREALKGYEEHLRSLEKSRKEAYGGLQEQLKSLATAHSELKQETGNLVTALRNPQVRGRWGEVSLHRVVELAGMSEHCDFSEQVSVSSEEGRVRPDMVVHLPAGRQIVVDAKVSLDAYLNALAAETEPERQRCLAEHARQTRDHMDALVRKSYWDQFESAPEFVVMFIPGESFFGAAVDNDPSLIEDGMKNRVVLATPTTLIALLRAVAYGWRQEQLAKNAQEISDLGRQLYDRLRVLAEHLTRIGGGLERAIGAYNDAVGSMERRVFPAARRFGELGVTATAEIPPIEPVETAPRRLSPPEPPEAED
jgi:DNA recombination protein RmuC